MSMAMTTDCSVMQNGFQFATGHDRCIVFLFPSWNVDSSLKYAFVIIGVFFLGISNGVLVFSRHLVISRWSTSSSFVGRQLCLSLLYGIHMLLAYWMMLLVMTYEAGVFMAILFGLTVGHFIFGLLQNRIPSTTSGSEPKTIGTLENQSSATPCCAVDS